MSQGRFIRFLRTWPVVAFALPLAAAEPDPAAVTFFENKIRPVLVERCLECHSAATKQRNGLRLDDRDALLKGGDGGPAVVPGKPNESLLIKAIRHEDGLMMPRRKMDDAVIADFVKWIETGAVDPRDGKTALPTVDFAKARSFWSFQPVRRFEPPAVKDAAWPKSVVDRFILAKLEEAQLRPAAPADKRTLLRRATFDLTGLPPTPEEIEAFERDATPQAFERVVERLLASPAYGERWGRHWLDVARYAEDQAHTFGTRPNSSAFRYRDWVIDAFNADMPFDRFVKLQIAADLIIDDDAERIRHLPALGFFGLGAQYYKDNTEIIKALADELDEKVDTLSRGLLGLTVACARCHDHKFDPVPTADYYSLAGVFNSSRFTDVALAGRQEVKKYQDDVQLAKKAEDALKTFVRDEKTGLRREQAGEIVRYMTAVRKVQEQRIRDPKWSPRDQAKRDGLNATSLDRWMKYLDAAPKAAALDAWRNLPKPTPPEPDGKVAEEKVRGAAEEFQKHVLAMLDGKADKAKAAEKTALINTLFADNNGLFVLSDDELKAKLPADKRAKMEQMRAEAMRLRKDAPDKMEARFPIAHAVSDATPGDMKIYLRGNPLKTGDTVPRRFLRVLAGDEPKRFVQGSGRRELAEAVASPDNPLTARVIVNRVWGWHFGRGIVGTPSNFGALGERPSHPELLDRLTADFIASGWSIKSLHRAMMLTATYQLSSTPDDRNMNVDADNRTLWRMNRRRLDVESWRDALLATAGTLDRSLGGPTAELSSSSNRRRTVYAKVSRHELNGLLRLFDFPDANITSEKRTETTVPQQQLFVLNSAFMVAQAKALAARLQKEGDDDASRVKRAHLLAFGRPADETDVALALRFLSAEDAAADKAANKLTRWERFAQAVLAGNEFLYVD